MRSEHFQIVICHLWVELPSIPFAWTMNTLTFAPELFEDEAGQEAAYAKMQGDTSEICLELFHGLKNELIVNLLETYQSLTPSDDAAKKNIQDLIESVPRIPSIRM